MSFSELASVLPVLAAAWPNAFLGLFSLYILWRLMSLEKEVLKQRAEQKALERKFAVVCNAYVHLRALLFQLAKSLRLGKKPDLDAIERVPSLTRLLGEDPVAPSAN